MADATRRITVQVGGIDYGVRTWLDRDGIVWCEADKWPQAVYCSGRQATEMREAAVRAVEISLLADTPQARRMLAGAAERALLPSVPDDMDALRARLREAR